MINYLFGIWQFLLLWSVGWLVLKRFNVQVLPYGYQLALAFGLGELLFSYTYFALGLLGGLRFWVLIPATVLLSILTFPGFLLECRKICNKAFPWIMQSPLATGISLIILVIYALGASVPEREVDSLWYHIATPLRYIMNGGYIQLVPFNMPSHYPMNIHLHYSLSLLVGNDTTCKVFIFLHFIPMLLLLWSAVQYYGNAKWGLFAVAVYLCCLHFRLPVMANVQRAVYFHVFLSMILLWWSLEHRNYKFFWLAALFCGMSMGTKFNGLMFCYVGQWFFLVIWFFVLRSESFWTGMKYWVGHSLIAWTMMSPWLIKSWIFTNNPLYPMLGSIFPTDPHFVPAMHSNDNNHGVNWLKSDSVSEFFSQINQNINWLLFNADLIFFLGIMAAFVLLVIRNPKWKLPAISILVAYFLFTWLWGSDIARLFAANYGIVVLCVALMAQTISHQMRLGAIITTLILISLFVTFIKEKYSYLKSPNISWFCQIALTEQDRREWLSERDIFSNDLFAMKQWVDGNVPANHELYGYRTGYLFYLDRKYIVSGAHFGEQFEKWFNNGYEYFINKIEEYEIKWILFDENASQYQGETEKELWQKFVQDNLKEVHRENNIILYQIKTEF